jgi:hypothetical protein
MKEASSHREREDRLEAGDKRKKLVEIFSEKEAPS